MPTSVANINRKRGDTRRIVFQLKDKGSDSPVDITAWSNFLMTVDPASNPEDNSANLGQITGVVIDAVTGRVAFSPDGSIGIGKHYYDAQAIDENSEKITFVEGKYVVEQDITKD